MEVAMLGITSFHLYDSLLYGVCKTFLLQHVSLGYLFSSGIICKVQFSGPCRTSVFTLFYVTFTLLHDYLNANSFPASATQGRTQKRGQHHCDIWKQSKQGHNVKPPINQQLRMDSLTMHATVHTHIASLDTQQQNRIWPNTIKASELMHQSKSLHEVKYTMSSSR